MFVVTGTLQSSCFSLLFVCSLKISNRLLRTQVCSFVAVVVALAGELYPGGHML